MTAPPPPLSLSLPPPPARFPVSDFFFFNLCLSSLFICDLSNCCRSRLPVCPWFNYTLVHHQNLCSCADASALMHLRWCSAIFSSIACWCFSLKTEQFMVQNIRSFSLNVSVVVWHTWTHACCLFDVLYCQAFSVELWPSWFCLCVQGWSDPDETVQSDQRRSALLLPCPLLPLPLLSLSPSGLVLTTCDGAPPRLAIDAEPCSQAPGRRRRDRGEEGDGRGRHHLRNFCVSRESGCQLQDQQDALWSVSDFQVNSSGFFCTKSKHGEESGTISILIGRSTVLNCFVLLFLPRESQDHRSWWKPNSEFTRDLLLSDATVWNNTNYDWAPSVRLRQCGSSAGVAGLVSSCNYSNVRHWPLPGSGAPVELPVHSGLGFHTWTFTKFLTLLQTSNITATVPPFFFFLRL